MQILSSAEPPKSYELGILSFELFSASPAILNYSVVNYSRRGKLRRLWRLAVATQPTTARNSASYICLQCRGQELKVSGAKRKTNAHSSYDFAFSRANGWWGKDRFTGNGSLNYIIKSIIIRESCLNSKILYPVLIIKIVTLLFVTKIT